MRAWRSSGLAKGAAVLTFGTGLAQAVTLAGYVVLARLYTPEQFGVFAVVFGVATIAGAVASGRYELTILLPRSQRAARLALATSLALSVGSIVALALFLFALSATTGYQWAGRWAAISTAALSLAVINVVSYRQNRDRRYSALAGLQVCRAVAVVLFSIAARGNLDGLILGFVCGCLVALLACVSTDWRELLESLRELRRRRVAFWILRHRKFLQYSTPAVLLGSLAAQMPVFLMSLFHGPAVAGYFSLIYRTALAPVTLVSGAINRVYMQKVAALRAEGHAILPFTRRLAGRMSGFALAGAALFGLFCYAGGYRLVFGPAWANVDRLALLLAPVLAFSLVSKTVAGFAVVDRNEVGLLYQAVLATAVLASLGLSGLLSNDPFVAFAAFSAVLSLAYASQVLAIIRIAASHDRQ